MKQRTMLELIKQHHPQMGNAEARIKLNNAQDDFCAKTELIRNTYRQLSTAGKRYYTLDKDILRILKVQLDDIDIPRLLEPPVIDDDEFDGAQGRQDANTGATKYAWYVSNKRLGVVEYIPEGITINHNKTYYQSISTSDLEIRLFTIGQASDFTSATMNNESDLPTQFHEALVYKVVSDGYLSGDNLQPELSQLFDAKYMSLVKEAKKQGRSNYQTDGIIRPQDF
jgi:hypothetical protein